MADRITIINNDDGTVDAVLNGENVARVPTTNLDSSIHAVQWYGDHGEVEYNDHNEKITDFSEFDAVMVDRQNEVDRIVEEAINNELPQDELDRITRDDLLSISDWVVVKHTELGEPIPQEWQEYRQALRDITEQAGFPGNVEWPTAPTVI